MQPAWPKCYAFRIPNEVQQSAEKSILKPHYLHFYLNILGYFQPKNQTLTFRSVSLNLPQTIFLQKLENEHTQKSTSVEN